ncbi:delta24(24-1) sterol reductase [Naegleria gruberi]|uniref:Delta(24(24(1)))-sterol reductase n=1 Tax=Naegleria gruberi TaxID=5762 RepID=D2VYV9_NAEGR|nr:delta24(24-1) sterol reductase [Naegleria gruberi]EFC38024.1 delta24(24-1) sterol reductase [Naegleria gruberi]|eukprot:XP_002670768.1 delta24(24-1) sterol reductase [Naegleria gruberi strain NEG-M]
MIISHIIPYYYWYCLEFTDSKLVWFWDVDWSAAWEIAQPNWTAFNIYMGFIVYEGVLGWLIPGDLYEGLPLEHEGGKKLIYNCNAIHVWYITLPLIGILYVTGIAPVSMLYDNFAPILTVAIIFSNLVAIFTYFYTIATGNEHRLSGSFLYDFFMGAVLNPRLGSLDLKMFTEARISWVLLFLLTLSAAAKQYEELGYITTPMIFMLTAHTIYVNAIMKGEECVPSSWDIFYEKWGWLLIYWNLAGVPFVYCFSSIYIYKKGEEINMPWWYNLCIFILLFVAYYFWDTAQSQRNRFRMKKNGTFRERKTFPQLPYGTLPDNAKCLKTKAGSELLVDGWWAYARKLNYTMDTTMGLTWGLICGFGSFIPYFYFIFFFCMIIHRYHRDSERCKRKYKEDWDKYCETVKYIFIPGII